MITTRELSKHIYEYILKSHGVPTDDPMMMDKERDIINYVSYLMELHFEPDNHLGSKGFERISKDLRSEFGC
jgi:hypothetical protein